MAADAVYKIRGRYLKDVIAQQTASSSMSGSTGGSTSSTVEVSLSDGTVSAAGVASSSSGTYATILCVSSTFLSPRERNVLLPALLKS